MGVLRCHPERAIVNATIKACDPLDGRTDGVISRTDLCKLHFNMSSVIGQEYYCAAETSTSVSKPAAIENKPMSAAIGLPIALISPPGSPARA